jgi:hypothetical protein
MGGACPLIPARSSDKFDKSERNIPLFNGPSGAIFTAMSTVQEIEAAIPKLPRHDLEQLKAWFDEFYEDSLELTDEVQAKLDQAREDIAAGRYRTRQPQ